MGNEILRTYYDTAGSQNDPLVLVTVGVLSTPERWEKFDKAWLRVLAEFRVSSVHMLKVAQWKGDLAKWNQDEDRRIELLTMLVKVMKRYVNKVFVRAVELEAFREHDKTYCLTETLGGAYCYAQAGCITATRRWCKEKRPNAKLQVLVAHGDSGQHGFRKFLKKSFGVEPDILPARHEETGEDITPLSAADLIAYEHRILYGKAIPNQAFPPFASWRGILRLLREQLPIEAGVLKPNDIEQFCVALKVPRRGESGEQQESDR